jgi:cytochrome b
VNHPERRTEQVRVWDLLVRVLHWSLVGSVAGAWITSELGRRWHEPIGWFMVCVIVLRLSWGFAGRGYARFARFVCGPRAALAYASQVARGDAPRYLGHNPFGAWMIVALLLTVSAIALTGWLLDTDMFFGSEAMEDLHEDLSQGLLALVALHVLGVLFTSRRQAENLVRAMVTGRKRAPQPGDVD